MDVGLSEGSVEVMLEVACVGEAVLQSLYKIQSIFIVCHLNRGSHLNQ